MFEKMMAVDQSNLKWALVAIGITSFFVNGTPRLILNVLIFLIAAWILLALRTNSEKQRDK